MVRPIKHIKEATKTNTFFQLTQGLLEVARNFLEAHTKLIDELAHGRPINELDPKDQVALQRVIVNRTNYRKNI